MSDFHFYHSIEVRYGDLDTQWHVNNVRIVQYIENARTNYLIQLGLWDGENFLDLGLIVADVHIAYAAPIHLRTPVKVGARTVSIGTKSMKLEYSVENSETREVLARAETVMVGYDYHTSTSRPIPADWREKISAFEGINF